MKKLLFTICLFFVSTFCFSQNDRIIGLIDKKLVEVNPYVPSLQTIVEYEFPNGSDGTDMAYSTTTCLFYTILDATDNPKLISFDFFGNVELVGTLTLPGGTVYTCESIAYDQVNDKMYISGSLNGVDFFSESLMTVDIENAQCEFATSLIFENGNREDMDNMVIHNEILYFNDGLSLNNPDMTDYYSFSVNNLDNTTPLFHYHRETYDGTSDVAYFNDKLYMPNLDFDLLVQDPLNPPNENLGTTHTSNDYNGARIRGFEYIEDLTLYNYNDDIGLDTILCGGGEIEINLEATELSILWNTNETGPMVTAREEGVYFAEIYLNECLIAITDTVSLSFSEGAEETLELLFCEGNPISINNITYDVAGEYTQDMTTSDGLCDSTLFINLVAEDPNFIDEYIELCEGETYIIGDSTYTEPGSYFTVFPSVFDCDSIIYTQLTVSMNSEELIELFECMNGMVEVNGIVYDQSGMYEQAFTNARGCDSTLYISVDISSTVVLNESYTLCENGILSIYDLEITEPGNYDITLSNNDICDTIVNVSVNEISVAQEFISFTLCDSETIEINNTNYTEAGSFEQSLISSDGCDSLLLIDILSLASSFSEIEKTPCPGTDIEINGILYDSPGNYTQTLINSDGCDSLLNITVTTSDIYIPNIFSPDISGNDTFKPLILCETPYYEFSVFDRWGNLVFWTNQPEASWDGNFENSGFCEQGIYTYMVKFGETEENPGVLAGDVMLLR